MYGLIWVVYGLQCFTSLYVLLLEHWKRPVVGTLGQDLIEALGCRGNQNPSGGGYSLSTRRHASTGKICIPFHTNGLRCTVEKNECEREKQ